MHTMLVANCTARSGFLEETKPFPNPFAIISFNCPELRSGKLVYGSLPLSPRRSWNQTRISMRQGADRENPPPGDDAPETLFMRELRRRGMSQTSLSNDSQGSPYGSTGTEIRTKEGEAEVIGTSEAQSKDARVKARSDWSDERSRLDQRQKSMALNSEGLDGLIPRAQALLSYGGSFFLAFWPLILSSLTIFLACYLYFGAEFIHPGNNTRGRPPYVDPYQLLEEENLPSEIGPSRVPFNYQR